MTITPIATIHNAHRDKFGIPRQSGLAARDVSYIVFKEEFRTPEAIREIESYSHLWLLWHFSENSSKRTFSPTVRPPRLGGNRRVGVFATRSPNRPNSIGLSNVTLGRVIKTEKLGHVLEVYGADIMSGTEIFDIKPYIAYCDSRPEAIGGFADDFANYALTLDFPCELMSKLDEKEKEVLADILAGDPRPSYQNDKDRIYALDHGRWKVSFSVDGDTLHVRDVVKNENGGDEIYEYMRMYR